MKIWFVPVFENTPLDDNKNTRYNSLVNEAVARGHEVVFWTSTFRHNVKAQRYAGSHVEEVGSQLKIRFVNTKPYRGNISFGRLFSHLSLSHAMVAEFESEKQLPDVIMVAFPPISTAYEIVRWAKKKNIPVITDIIDPWPDVFLNHLKGLKKIAAGVAIYPLRKRVSYIFKNTRAIASISNQYLEWAKSYNPEIANEACFYPAVQFDEMKRQLARAAQNTQKDKDTLHIIYAGSLGFSYDMATILKTAEILAANYNDKIKFTIAGEGPQRQAIETYTKTHGNLRYLGRLPKEKLMEEYYKADIGLTQHIAKATQSVTYKLFDLLACGLPIMNSLESEMKTIILSNQVGFHNEPGNAQQLADNILRCYNDRALLSEMKKNAIALTAEKGDSAIVYSKALDYIEVIAKS